MELDRSNSPLGQVRSVSVSTTAYGGRPIVRMMIGSYVGPPFDRLFTAQEAEDLATMLMYYAKEVRDGNS